MELYLKTVASHHSDDKSYLVDDAGLLKLNECDSELQNWLASSDGRYNLFVS